MAIGAKLPRLRQLLDASQALGKTYNEIHAAHLAVGEDVHACPQLVVDGDFGGVVERLLQVLGAKLAARGRRHHQVIPTRPGVAADGRDGKEIHSFWARS